MQRPRGPAAILLGVGAALLILSQILVPRPADFEQWACCGGAEGDRFAARGPAVARYDAANDTTYAAIPCAHQYCAIALRIPGDARAALEQPHFLLIPLGPLSRDWETLDPPLGMRVAGTDRGVDRVSVTKYHVASPLPGALFAAIALAVLALGAGLLFGTNPAGWIAGGAGALGAGIGFAAANEGMEGAILIFLGLLPLAFLGLLMLTFGRRWPRVRALGAIMLLFAAGALATAWAIEPYFVHPPTL